MSTNQNFCADCQHLRIVPTVRHPMAVCASAAFASDPVTGDPEHSCVSERTFTNGMCGKQGVLFEPRNPLTWVAWVSRPGPLLDAKYTL